LVQTDEERNAKNKEYKKKYMSKPENVAKEKARKLTSEYKAKARVRAKKYDSKPEVKAKKKIYNQSSKHKTYLKEYRESPRGKAIRKENRNRPENKLKMKTRWQEQRVQVYSVYSKRLSNSDIPCCNCCGETIMEFLAVDHIKGRKHLPENEKKLTSKTLLPFLIKNDYPEDYQILCHNCNSAKGFYGQCPHETARKEETFAMMEEQSSFEV
jgi:hypothetical protein